MSFKVFGGYEKEPTRFQLQELHNGGIKLIMVDNEGLMVASGEVLQIRPDGVIILASSVNRTMGLTLDEEHKVVIDKY